MSPYIKPIDRERLDKGLHPDIQTVGELNYCIIRLCQRFLANDEISYKMLNAVIGALESAKLELYRRLVIPFENSKIKSNGDVFDA